MNPPARAVPITVVDKRTPRPPVAAAARTVEGIPPVARPPVGEIADFMWLDGSGEIAKPLEESPIQDGIALLHQNEPLPHGALWAITIHDANGVLVFRSGPLPALPGPPSPINASYIALMLTDGASFGLAPNEGAEALVLEQLHSVPKALRIDSVSLHADSAGHEVVVVRGAVKRFLFSQSFAYTRALTLRPSKRPGHPAELIVAELAGPASVVGSDIRAFSAAHDAAIVAGVELVMNDIARQVADGNLFLNKASFPATLVTVTGITVHPEPGNVGQSINFQGVYGGTITGGLVTSATGGLLRAAAQR
jgi:hypothetical protein